MEGKNLILAIALSALLLIMWSIFFAPPPPKIDKEQNKIQKSLKDDKLTSPSIKKTKKTKSLSRKESLKSTKRISIENENIYGSISLLGGIIDDIIFKNYNESLNSKEKVI